MHKVKTALLALVVRDVQQPQRRRLAVLSLLAVCCVCPAPAHGASFVYVTNQDLNNVSQFSAGAGGLLTPLTPPTVDAGTFPVGVVVSPSGRSLYVGARRAGRRV
jgi:hypothetical protein